MEQHFGGAEELQDVRCLWFADESRPDKVECGDTLELKLVDVDGEAMDVEVRVTSMERYMDGYVVIGMCNGSARMATITVNKKHPAEDGVRLQSMVALMTPRRPRGCSVVKE